MMLANCTALCNSWHPFMPIVLGSSKEVYYVLMNNLHPRAIYIANSCDSIHFIIFFSGDLFKIVLHGLPLAPFEVMMGYVSV